MQFINFMNSFKFNTPKYSKSAKISSLKFKFIIINFKIRLLNFAYFFFETAGILGHVPENRVETLKA